MCFVRPSPSGRSATASGHMKVWHLTSLTADTRHFEALAKHLPRQGIDVAIGSLGEHPTPAWARNADARYFQLNSRGGPSSVTAAVRLARLLRRNRVDLLQTHLLSAALVGVPAGWLART